MSILPRRLLLALLLTPIAARAQAAPVAPVQALNQAIVQLMRSARSTSFEQRLQAFTPVVQQSFDLPLILRTAVGPRWTSFPPEVQAELLTVFTRFTVASYVANFDDFNGERFEILPETRRVGADEVVQTRLVQPSGDPIRLDYVVRPAGEAWKIVDVLLNGSISRVAVQRSDFRSLLGNGDAAPLIASLRQKVARLAAGETE
ncbi:Toluene tolerance protein [Rhodovastum atsumiense]|uniref:Toluene tolerance protein n=1 Tax=Rhodovastum atsumiense TaxID=504468 RepID=A0A5M6IQU8_9PROT|nr:ABC transporter substrate-binding protein [Rhodovastum atsumiense]KAA5610317.1 toluene tolerance protein [Rhodovastum atsumiense]CAH2600945.1 Toluene tolerance protein [Rhodovastum atsumiense]